MRRLRLILIVLVVIVAVGWVVFNGIQTNFSRRISETTITDFDLSTVEDGVHTGSFKVFPVSATVRVTIEDHAIASVELVEHNHGKGAAAEVIPGIVVEAQTLQVDIVSGATYSSKVILKAIENALKSGQK